MHDQRSWSRPLALLLVVALCLGSVIGLVVGANWQRIAELFDRAAPLSQPTTLEVRADRPWQPSGLRVEAGQAIRIRYLAGSVVDGTVRAERASGWDYVCGQADCCEPLPAGRRAALVASIGGATLFIGDDAWFAAPASGELLLRINDCDDGLYDNSGSLQVQIAPATQ